MAKRPVITNEARLARREALRELLGRALAAHDAEYWISELRTAGVPARRVNDLDGAFAFAAELGLGPAFTLAREDGSTVAQVANPLRLSSTPVRYHRPPPALGQHTEEVIAWLLGRPAQD